MSGRMCYRRLDEIKCPACRVVETRLRFRPGGGNFFFEEYECRCGCGHAHPTLELLAAVQELRDRRKGEIRLSSGWRCRHHPRERIKRRPGYHNKGLAVDVLCSGDEARRVLELALEMEIWTGILLQQSGPWQSRFAHLDIRPGPSVIATPY